MCVCFFLFIWAILLHGGYIISCSDKQLNKCFKIKVKMRSTMFLMHTCTLSQGNNKGKDIAYIYFKKY